MIGVLFLALSGEGAAAALSLGSRGSGVAEVQGYLVALGLLSGRPDGVYGQATREAVRAFQAKEGLAADGVVGPATLSRLKEASGGARTITYRVSRGDTVYGIARRYGTTPARVIALNGLARPELLQPGQTLKVPAGRGKSGTSALPPRDPGAEAGGVELLPWAEVNRLFPNGAEARVTDVRSGRTFRVRRIQGTYHADAEPRSFEDTEAMRAAYGGAWSWDRHAVVVEIGGRKIAASMNGYPHGTGHPQRNGFRGHFCLHFHGSRTHGTRVVDPGHQAAIMAAARYGGSVIEEGGAPEPVTASAGGPED